MSFEVTLVSFLSHKQIALRLNFSPMCCNATSVVVFCMLLHRLRPQAMKHQSPSLPSNVWKDSCKIKPALNSRALITCSKYILKLSHICYLSGRGCIHISVQSTYCFGSRLPSIPTMLEIFDLMKTFQQLACWGAGCLPFTVTIFHPIL